MKRSLVALGLVLVVAALGAGGQNPLTQGYYFTDAGGNDATVGIEYTRVSDAETLQFQFTTSDTVEYQMNATTFNVGTNTITYDDVATTPGELRVNCTVLEVAGMIDQSCFISDRVYTVTAIDLSFTVTESAGTLGLMPTKQEGTEAAASGQDLLSAAFDGTATAETVQAGALTATAADLVLADGDRIGLDFTGDTAGVLQGVVVTFTLIPG